MDATPSTSPAAAIAARGYPITLMDGTVVHLRYSMLSLRKLEEQFGNLASIIAHVENAASALEAQERARKGIAEPGDEQLVQRSTGAIFTALSQVLLPGLLDEQGTDPRTHQAVWLEDREDVALRLLDPGQLQPYMLAFRQAFTEAFGTGEQPQDGGAFPPPLEARATAAPPSPGPTGTTSPAAWPTAPMPSSGA